jgi:putative flavoprotein involved in K+ transport
MEAVEAGHPTILSGKGHGQLPFSVDSRRGRMAWPLLRFVAWNVLTIRTPIGRKMAPNIRSNGGAPLLRYRRPELMRAGVELTDARTVRVEDGRPVLADGRVLDVANVIWCTGFAPDFGWIDLPIFDEDGFPREVRGVVEEEPGLYFLGVIFQFAFTSMLVVGASRDAAHVVDRLVARAGAGAASASPAPSAEAAGAVRGR